MRSWPAWRSVRRRNFPASQEIEVRGGLHVADQAPASEQPKAEQRADPANAQYMIAITPEQYESHLKHAATRAAVKEAGPRPQMEMGGTGTAKASFKDAADGDVEITSTEWSATGPVTVTADENDPTSANI